MTRRPFDRDDRLPIAIVALLPLLAATPAFLGWIASDPMLYTGEISLGRKPGILPGVPSADPNVGFTTQALGRLSALEWLRGEVPWWNAFTGVGVPLAAEYQPAALSPLTFLQLLPHGMAWHQAVLQAIAGLGTYGLLRQMGFVRLASTAGALLFAFNGTLAWFGHGPATAVAWIPWMVWGVERACQAAQERISGGWRIFAVATAMGLLAGFPETTYIGGLMALAWAIVRGSALDAPARLALAARLVPAGLVGLAITAPQTASFFHFLAHAEIGGHADFSRAGYPWFAVFPLLLAPYFYGPIFGLGAEWQPLWDLWGGLGGYTTAALVVVAIFGLAARPSRLNWMLAAWVVLVLGKSFVLQPALFLWNLVPGVTIAAFARYAPPTWELALIILAAAGMDAISRGAAPRRSVVAATLGLAGMLGGGLWLGTTLWNVFPQGSFLRIWSAGSACAGAGAAILALALLWSPHGNCVRRLAGLLLVESIVLFQLPLLSSPRGAVLDRAAIEFLRQNLGLHRFFTLGPFQPNYGAYFGLASINHNYLPVPKRWTEHVRKHLDSAADPVVFNGNHGRTPGAPTQVQELLRNLSNYEWVGVKYVIGYTAHNPPFPPASPAARRVYSDELLTIYELPDPRPYFEVVQGRCEIGPAPGRTRLSINCLEPSTLLRRELFFPGWRATINGAQARIEEHRTLFQQLRLPAGSSDVRFDYAPPHIGLAWLLSALGLAALVAGFMRRGGSKTGS